MQDPLLTLLNLSEHEKEARGLTDTPREIFQQPETWKSTFLKCVARAKEISSFLGRSGIGASGRTVPSVFLVGAGTSDYIGRALVHLLRARWKCEAWAVPSTDLLTSMDTMIAPGREYLWITFSRSGDSPEGVAVLERALAQCKQIRHLVITCNREGKMARICSSYADASQALVLDATVNDRGLAMTSSFTNMLVAGHCLAHLDDLEGYGEIVTEMSGAGRRFLESASVCASEIGAMGCSKACFVGSGALAAVANEAALKLLELTAGRVHTLAESALGFRHGPMAGLDKGTLLVVFLSSDDQRRPYEIDLLREVREKKLGRLTVVVTAHPDESLDALADFVMSTDTSIADAYQAPVDIMFAQLLGLFSSLHAGLQPDRPSPSGAISRVVSRVNIY